MNRSLEIGVALSLGAIVGACTQVAGLGGDYVDVGGAAGHPLTTTGGGGVPRSTGAVGGGGAGTCGTSEDCPVSASLCRIATCKDGLCGFDFAAQGTPVSEGQPGDCKSVVCDGQGTESTKDDDKDVPNDGLACTVDVCTQGTPSHSPAPAGTSCTDGGGAVCDGNGQCVACLQNGDCTTGLVCQLTVCVAPSCVDGTKDGGESDVDCGGSCAPCGPGKTCTGNTDCAGGVCSAAKTCAETCSDGAKNQNESDVDCGGVCGNTCALGKACTASADCASGYCAGGICQSACIDGKLDFGETDIDCGGPCPDCAQGKKCANMSDCQSGSCVDGFCCDQACTGICDACSAAKKGGGLDGACGPIAAGTDPDNECAAQQPASCGTDGMCNGQGACRKYAAGTLCSPTSCLNASTMLNADLCDGNGACVDGGQTSCGAYRCSGAGCKTTCATDNDCAAASYCNGSGQCVTKGGLGAACTGATGCASGFCVDGVCCDSACTSKCMACSAAKKGQGTDGTCQPVALGGDPDNECAIDPVSTCGNTGACDGAGACAKYPAGTVCAPASCDVSTFLAASTCNGSGSCVAAVGVSCAPYACAVTGCLSACATDADCASGYLCVAPICQ